MTELPGSSLVRSRRRWRPVTSVCLLAGLSGCANHNERSEVYLAQLEAGRWDEAVRSAERSAADGPDRNRVIDELELGALANVAGRWGESDRSLGLAWDAMEAFGEPGDPTFMDNLAAIAVNERALPYMGGSTDRTMCATLRALDLLAQGDLVNARVELKRAQFAQEDAEARYRSRIEAARARMEEEEGSLGSIEQSAAFQENAEATWGDLEERFSPYRGWTIPFTDWLTSVVLMVDGSGSGDRNRAIDLLRRVGGVVGPNPAIQADLDLAEASGTRVPQVWVVLGSGLAPRREEVVFRLPAFIPELPFIGVAFPKLVQSPFGPLSGTVAGGGSTAPLGEVCDMGSVIAQEFQAELPLIKGRAIGAAVAKAAASVAANVAARNTGNDWALLASMVATNVYGYATTLADLRTWRTLPRAWSVGRIPRPADGILRLQGEIGNHELAVPGDPGDDALVLVRCVAAGGPASIHGFPLAPARDSDPSVADSPEGDRTP
ncbi:MAG: hypothetical protein VX672_10110 [Planctomycetota bacterium]|nr:hypothetical protein [Planctomycetota bacterium]